MSKYWCFTVNNPSDELKIINDKDVEYVIYQKEKVTTVHLQGYIVFYKKKALSVVKNFFKNKYQIQPHLEMRKGDHQQAKDYCKKSDSRIAGPYEFGSDAFIPIKNGQRNDLDAVKENIEKGLTYEEILDLNFTQCVKYHRFIKTLIHERDQKIFDDLVKKEYLEQKLKPWQSELLEEHIINMKPREIIWVTGKKGQEGKSFMADYLRINYQAFFATNKKSADLAFLYNREKMIIFNFTRDNESKINYQMIEEYSDGRIISTKYEPEKKFVKDPKVIIFANWYPEIKITESRLNIFEIVKDELVQVDIKDVKLALSYKVEEKEQKNKYYFD